MGIYMNPNISDFGMARIFSGDEQQANTNRVVGTYGYMSPEYAMEGLFSVESNVYSFGMLLLETVSGLRISSTQNIEEFPNLIIYAWSLWREGLSMDLVDPSVSESCSDEESRSTPLATPGLISPLYFAQRNEVVAKRADYGQDSVDMEALTELQ